MTIGRTDIIIPTAVGPAKAIELAVRSAAGLWATAVITDGDDEQTYAAAAAVPFAALSEVLVFADAAARLSLRRLGPTPATANRMFDFIAVPGELTVVVDDPADPATRSLLDTLERSLQPMVASTTV